MPARLEDVRVVQVQYPMVQDLDDVVLLLWLRSEQQPRRARGSDWHQHRSSARGIAGRTTPVNTVRKRFLDSVSHMGARPVSARPLLPQTLSSLLNPEPGRPAAGRYGRVICLGKRAVRLSATIPAVMARPVEKRCPPPTPRNKCPRPTPRGESRGYRAAGRT